jgi:GntR family transcriptional regulator
MIATFTCQSYQTHTSRIKAMSGSVPAEPARLAGRDPLYARVVRQIESEIADGALMPGARLASERLLCERLGISRDTLRHALAELAEAGRIEPAPRRGWFVAGRSIHEPLAAPQSLTVWAAGQGLTASSRVVRADVRLPTPDEAATLGLAPGEVVFDLERVRVVGGAPLSLDRASIVLARAPFLPEVDFSSESLYRVLRERAGIVPSKADYEVGAALADERTAHLLEIESGAAILRVTETVFDQAGAPFELSRFANRGDRYRYRTTLLRPA